ncbi:hypothetical protein M0R88_11035 [Halorussus gelatinilyticus]|uniref:Uncharacterized protein n=1 Tax=Halorussus gelatinilyticus TaxID=2937524 RepID=A0A8U0IEE9_9EURY|nr:hypothetical protein [Halorussus gelatinilyticus]UPV99060.1 hypothetical protein M0R88_11035 [Halorussus gelatinilyticus]
MASRSVALVVVVLVVLAGCTAGGSAPTDTTATSTASPTIDSPTTTPAANDTGTDGTPANATAANTTTANRATNDSTANASLPPGVNATGVADAETLVGAHKRALNNTSFAFRFRANVSVGPASQWTLQYGSVGEGLSPLVVHSNSVRQFDGGTSSTATDLWANETAVVVRYHGENRTELRRYNRSGGNVADETWAHLPRADLDSQVSQSWLLELALTAGDYRRVETERTGNRTVTVLRATEPVAAANYTDLESTVRVDAAGRVRSLSLTATYRGDNETRIHYEFELTEVGNASVERPTWVGAATPPTTRPATTTTENATTTVPAETTTTTAGNATATGTTTAES